METKLSIAVEGYLLDIGINYSPGTVSNYKIFLRQLCEFLGDPDLQAVTPQDLQRYMIYMKNDYVPKRYGHKTGPLSPSCLDNKWKAIRSFYGWAEKMYGLERPDKGLARPKFILPEVEAFSQDEIKRILDAAVYTKEIKPDGKRAYRCKRPAGDRNRALIMTLLDTGLRLGELCRLKYEDLDIQTGELLITPYGTGRKTKPRKVYLGQAARRAMWLYLSHTHLQEDDPLFSENAKHIRIVIYNIGAQAQVSNCHPHRFRHTFAIQYLRNGGDVFTLQRLLGHSSLEMVKHYLHIVEGDNLRMHISASPVDRWRLK